MSVTTMVDNPDVEGITVLKKLIVISPDFPHPYLTLHFSVPVQATKVGVRSSHLRSNHRPRIYLSLFDPDKYRGTQMTNVRDGNVAYDLWVTQGSSAHGCVPGPIPDGEWRVQVDVSKLDGPVEVDLEVYYELDGARQPCILSFVDQRILDNEERFYRGELHAHSSESDGELSVTELIDHASEAGLDFLSISDHFTASQWYRVDGSRLPELILLNSVEITSQRGHANLQGINEWVDVFIDREDWSANHAAEETHRAGGLFCVNHAFSGELGWRHFDLDWSLVDLLEVFHSLEGPNNIAQIGMWDALLREGFRIIGVSGTDLHNPANEIERLGRTVTWVHARELSTGGILEGLKTGRVFVSLGPRIDFMISNADGNTSYMGGRIQSNNQPLELSISVEADLPLRCLIVKDGFFLHSKIFKPGGEPAQKYVIVDSEPRPGYYRLEFHDVVDDPDYTGIEWRDFRTLRVLSNPIWVD